MVPYPQLLRLEQLARMQQRQHPMAKRLRQIAGWRPGEMRGRAAGAELDVRHQEVQPRDLVCFRFAAFSSCVVVFGFWYAARLMW